MIEVTCSDARCEVREHCLRWQRREQQSTEAVTICHAMTLRPAWQCSDEPCDHALMRNNIAEES